MIRVTPFGVESGDEPFDVLWDDGELLFCNAWLDGADGRRHRCIGVLPPSESSPHGAVRRLAHEYALKDHLDGKWALRPLALMQVRGRTMLILEFKSGEPLSRLIGPPMEIGRFLRLANAMSGAICSLHERGLVHKDINPSHVVIDTATADARLTGFGIASRIPRERQPAEPPEFIAGTLAYMAPEQTGRMNRSIDSRSDLYSLGVTLYQALTGSLPFTAADPMEWVHCHVARLPVPPHERLRSVPQAVSAIVMKLLAKTPEERYQTASGVTSDVRRCLDEWQADGCVMDFVPGGHDAADRLLIPEKLYGREREIEILLAAFDRVVAGGRPELVLVSGYSGIGKSAVVHELHKPLVPPRGFFASGKFDQYKRDIPYATLAQSFQSLIRPLLSKSEEELREWRDALREALDPNGQLMVGLVPELKAIIGEQPPVPELPQVDAQARFHLVVRRFISVFARPEHPLALFLDDLQWLDAATLNLLEDLLIRSDLQHLMLIGAYRDNEVAVNHPLMRKLEIVKNAGGRVAEITLAPLAREHLGQLIADALRREVEQVAPLAQLVHEKTGGNPFFAIQFISSLADEGMLAFNHAIGRWSWDLDRIHARGYTDNVVDLMVGKLGRLPAETQNALKQLACLGDTAETTRVAIVLEVSEEQVHTALYPAVHQELVERSATSYRFVHDRVQEGAYSLIPEELRAEAHLRIGRLLIAHLVPEKRDEAIFDIVNQLNRGSALITSAAEHEQLAELNLLAAKRAKGSTAYVSALNYSIAGAALLPDHSWTRRHDLTFELALNRAECEFLTGALEDADERLAALMGRAANVVERASVACLHIDVCTAVDRSDRAVAVALEYLRQVGIEWPQHPTDKQARWEYDQIWSRLGSHAIEDVIDWPLMTDPESLATIEVLIKLMPPAVFTDRNLLCLTVCRMVAFSLERGNCDASCFGYVTLGTIAGPRFGDYQAGFRFGQLGHELVEQRGLKRFEGRIYLNFAIFVVRWRSHVRDGHGLMYRALEAANRNGDLTYAAYCSSNLLSNLLFAGDPLPDVQREAEHGLASAEKARFGLGIDIITPQLALILTLRGLTPKFGSLDGRGTEEVRYERHLADNPALAIAECWHWVRKLQARYFAGDYAAALEASSHAEPLLWTSTAFFEEAEFHFYTALSRAAHCESLSVDGRAQCLDALIAHQRQLDIWAANCPENFENRAALVAAEIARIEGRDIDAMRLYERAIGSAHTNGFVHNEALANELAARFYGARDFEKIAHTYLRDARQGYVRWGVDGKVQQLDGIHPWLRTDEPAPGPTSTIAARAEHLDLATVIKVSQAVSGEIVVERLLETLMRTAIEQAGAEQGLLVLSHDVGQRIAAEATTRDDVVAVALRDEPVSAAVLPESVLHYVLRTRESLILDDAVQSEFATDPYIRRRQVRSVLCVPLLYQANVIGVLFLENNLAPRVFAPARIAALKLLASQAAISLENTRLYRDLAGREAKIRRLVDSNIIGIVIWDLDGRVIDANDAFLRMVRYEREDLQGGLRWFDMTPPEWQDAHARYEAEELKATGMMQAREKEFFRKDGSRVPVLIGAACFEGQSNQGVAYIVDLTERKRAEADARESERRYREVETQLAHANRVATMGQLSAWIAHDVKQPLVGVVTNGSTGVRCLAADPPDLETARRAFQRIVRDGHRAADTLDRIRALTKKTQPEKLRVDLNEIVSETIGLVRAEAQGNEISLRTKLAGDLPRVYGDRIQLQQVIVNLIVNAIEAIVGEAAQKREVTIVSRMEANRAVVAVCDSGPGLQQESLNHAFDAFYTTKPRGMGMGLAISRSIVESHDGKLCAMSNKPCGAIFQFDLPIASNDAPSERKAP